MEKAYGVIFLFSFQYVVLEALFTHLVDTTYTRRTPIEYWELATRIFCETTLIYIRERSMPDTINRLNIARALTIIGFVIGLRSVGFTWDHIGSAGFLMTPESPLAVEHSWHHFFREVFGDAASMIVVLILLYVPQQLRQPAVWWSMLILLLGFYAPFWVGVPFMAELAAPSMVAEGLHVKMALPPMIGVFLCRSYYHQKVA
ncbi:MAG: hypothetical protein P8J68_04365 [Arenicellaceae bacterium]|nr:hypothetical protein [Arenicellaceae bacterium]